MRTVEMFRVDYLPVMISRISNLPESWIMGRPLEVLQQQLSPCWEKQTTISTIEYLPSYPSAQTDLQTSDRITSLDTSLLFPQDGVYHRKNSLSRRLLPI